MMRTLAPALALGLVGWAVIAFGVWLAWVST